jgi:Xaa-Pro aminopeptidase
MTPLLPAFDLSVFKARRQRLIATLKAQGGGIALIPTGRLKMRNADSPYPFRFDSSFYYLTGFNEPDAWLVLEAGPNGSRSTLFCQPKDPKMEIWEGLLWGPDTAAATFGFDQAFDCHGLHEWLPHALVGHRQVWAPMPNAAAPDLMTQLQTGLSQAKSATRGLKTVPTQINDLSPLLNDMRVIKDAAECDMMHQSGRIAAQAHRQAMRSARAGIAEYVLEAEILKVFRQHGAQSPAYETIVAAGQNACILHHRAGPTLMHDGDLVLIDAGCELNGYASDITRTFPANGRFSGPQAALYDIVLAAQKAAIENTSPAHHFNAGHDAAVRVITQGLIDESLLKGSLDSQIEQETYKHFYMHRTGHWLGLDVHDVGRYRDLPVESVSATDADTTAAPPWRQLQPGMVLTIEPGLYVRPQDDVHEQFWHIGIRIEDDALVTPNGCELMTRDVPVERAEIEALMAESFDG